MAEIFDRYEEILGIIRGRGFFHELNEYLILAGEDILRSIGNEQDLRRQGNHFRNLFNRFETIAADTINRIHRADCNRRLRDGAGAGAGAEGRIAPLEDRDEIMASAILQIERMLDLHRIYNFVPQRGLFRVEAPPNLINAQNIAIQMNAEEVAFLEANIGQIHIFDNDLQRHAYNEMLLDRAVQRERGMNPQEEEEEEKKEEEEANPQEEKQEEDDVEEL